MQRSRKSTLPRYLALAKPKGLADQMNNESGIVPVRIITSSALESAEKESLVKNIESKLNRKVSAKNEIDPSIIGGIKLMVGNKVVDGSISHQLKKIKYTLEQV